MLVRAKRWFLTPIRVYLPVAPVPSPRSGSHVRLIYASLAAVHKFPREQLNRAHIMQKSRAGTSLSPGVRRALRSSGVAPPPHCARLLRDCLLAPAFQPHFIRESSSSLSLPVLSGKTSSLPQSGRQVLTPLARSLPLLNKALSHFFKPRQLRVVSERTRRDSPVRPAVDFPQRRTRPPLRWIALALLLTSPLPPFPLPLCGEK